MEEKYRDMMEELLYQISEDIYDLTNADYEDVIDAIVELSKKVNRLSDNIYDDEIVYGNLKFNLT